MIGSCDCCDRRNVPVSNLVAYGIDTTACFICRGGNEVDPYGEIENIGCAALAPDEPYPEDAPLFAGAAE